MEIQGSARLNELSLRFQESIASNPDWFLQYVKANSEGSGPLPYHPNMGLSVDEYREMLRLTEDLRMVEAGEADLEIRVRNDSEFVLQGGQELEELTGLRIDLKRNRVVTPFGTTTATEPITATPEQKVTGPWEGITWKLEEGDPEGPLESLSGGTVKLSLGRLQESGRGILYYDVKKVEKGKQIARISRVLTYDLPSR